MECDAEERAGGENEEWRGAIDGVEDAGGQGGKSDEIWKWRECGEFEVEVIGDATANA